jgi:hypothetical protein
MTLDPALLRPVRSHCKIVPENNWGRATVCCYRGMLIMLVFVCSLILVKQAGMSAIQARRKVADEHYMYGSCAWINFFSIFAIFNFVMIYYQLTMWNTIFSLLMRINFLTLSLLLSYALNFWHGVKSWVMEYAPCKWEKGMDTHIDGQWNVWILEGNLRIEIRTLEFHRLILATFSI